MQFIEHSGRKISFLIEPPVAAKLTDVLQQLDAVRGGAGKGAAHLHWLEGGHWLHVDNTAGLQRWLGEHLLIA